MRRNDIDIRKILSNIKTDQTQIIDLIRQSSSSEKRLVLMGVTGSGKTTIANYLVGEKLSVLKSAIDGKFYLSGGVGIGHSMASKTTIPNLFCAKDNSLAILDCPGINDVNGLDQQIKNAFYIQALFNGNNHHPGLKKFTIALVVRDSVISIHDRGMELKKSLTEAVNLLDRAHDLVKENSLLLVTGGASNRSIESIKTVLGAIASQWSNSHINEGTSIAEEKRKVAAFIKALIASPNNRIFLFPAPDPNKEVYACHLLDEIKTTVSAIKLLPSIDANIVVPSEVHRTISNFANNVLKKNILSRGERLLNAFLDTFSTLMDSRISSIPENNQFQCDEHLRIFQDVREIFESFLQQLEETDCFKKENLKRPLSYRLFLKKDIEIVSSMEKLVSDFKGALPLQKENDLFRGLSLGKVNKSSDSLFYAIAPSLQISGVGLKENVLNYMETNIKCSEVHMKNVRAGKESAGNLEISAIEKQFCRPIIVLSSGVKPSFSDPPPSDKNPIFIYYDGNFYYEVTSKKGVDLKEIFSKIKKAINKNPNSSLFYCQEIKSNHQNTDDILENGLKVFDDNFFQIINEDLLQLNCCGDVYPDSLSVPIDYARFIYFVEPLFKKITALEVKFLERRIDILNKKFKVLMQNLVPVDQFFNNVDNSSYFEAMLKSYKSLKALSDQFEKNRPIIPHGIKGIKQFKSMVLDPFIENFQTFSLDSSWQNIFEELKTEFNKLFQIYVRYANKMTTVNIPYQAAYIAIFYQGFSNFSNDYNNYFSILIKRNMQLVEELSKKSCAAITAEYDKVKSLGNKKEAIKVYKNMHVLYNFLSLGINRKAISSYRDNFLNSIDYKKDFVPNVEKKILLVLYWTKFFSDLSEDKLNFSLDFNIQKTSQNFKLLLQLVFDGIIKETMIDDFNKKPIVDSLNEGKEKIKLIMRSSLRYYVTQSLPNLDNGIKILRDKLCEIKSREEDYFSEESILPMADFFYVLYQSSNILRSTNKFFCNFDKENLLISFCSSIDKIIEDFLSNYNDRSKFFTDYKNFSSPGDLFDVRLSEFCEILNKMGSFFMDKINHFLNKEMCIIQDLVESFLSSLPAIPNNSFSHFRESMLIFSEFTRPWETLSVLESFSREKKIVSLQLGPLREAGIKYQECSEKYLTAYEDYFSLNPNPILESMTKQFWDKILSYVPANSRQKKTSSRFPFFCIFKKSPPDSGEIPSLQAPFSSVDDPHSFSSDTVDARNSTSGTHAQVTFNHLSNRRKEDINTEFLPNKLVSNSKL